MEACRHGFRLIFGEWQVVGAPYPQFPDKFNSWTHSKVYVGAVFAGFIYGGLHCLAWNAPFPSDVQATLWRISSVVVTSTGLLLAALIFLLVVEPTRPLAVWVMSIWRSLRTSDGYPLEYRNRVGISLDARKMVNNLVRGLVWTSIKTLQILVAMYLIGCYLAIVLYVLARIYLVVECFINLAYLPQSAYKLPEWSQDVPHIG
jgi:hypothetical protein